MALSANLPPSRWLRKATELLSSSVGKLKPPGSLATFFSNKAKEDIDDSTGVGEVENKTADQSNDALNSAEGWQKGVPSSGVFSGDHEPLSCGSSMRERFEKWIVEHGRTYKDAEEKERRFKIYQSNVEYINEYNSENQVQLGDRTFGDMTREEVHRSCKCHAREDEFRWWLKGYGLELEGARKPRYWSGVSDH